MVMMERFDARQVEPAKPFEALPAGRYLAVIIESEEKATKKGTGRYLQLAFEIIEGDHKGRRVYARLNLVNPNPVAVQIAEGELSAICHAVGVLEFIDSQDLHDIPLTIQVKTRKRNDADEVQNEIKGYEAASAMPSQTAANYRPPQATQQTAPWGRPS